MKMHLPKASFFLLAFILLMSTNALNRNHFREHIRGSIEKGSPLNTYLQLDGALKLPVKKNTRIKPLTKDLPVSGLPDQTCGKC
jgi:hypothetical protein